MANVSLALRVGATSALADYNGDAVCGQRKPHKFQDVILRGSRLLKNKEIECRKRP
jgi:hypothetical protein